MDSGVLGILGFVLLFVALDLAALRFGQDSRSMAREMPLSGDAGIRLPPGIGRRPRAPLAAESREHHAPRAWPALSHAPAAIVRSHRSGKPFRPYLAGGAYAYPRFDMAAVGKQDPSPNRRLTGVLR